LFPLQGSFNGICQGVGMEKLKIDVFPVCFPCNEYLTGFDLSCQGIGMEKLKINVFSV
jgi:hypothetical protein